MPKKSPVTALVMLAALLLSAPGWPQNTAEWPNTDFSQKSIELKEVMSGGPPKDGIPSIDAPKFLDYAGADKWLADSEPVIALAHREHAKAYPLQILMWHEIVNDSIGDQPVTVTFCPLCNASIVFDRRIDGVIHDFGTTGRLRHSDMIMYDRQTESWWQQFVGEGIVGEMTGVTLRQIPSQIVSYEAFKRAYPDGEVLSRETGHQRRYGQNPYAGYDDISASPFLFRGKIDSRLPPMERVLSVRINADTLLFPYSSLKDQQVLNTRFSERPLAVFAFDQMNSALDGRQIAQSRLIPAAAVYNARLGERELSFDYIDGHAVDRQTRSRWNVLGQATDGPLSGSRLQQIDAGVHFAFAWLAFDPAAQIYQP